MVGRDTLVIEPSAGSILYPGIAGLVPDAAASPLADVSFTAASPAPTGQDPHIAETAKLLGFSYQDVATLARQNPNAFKSLDQKVEDAAKSSSNVNQKNGTLTASARGALPVGAQISMSDLKRIHDNAAGTGGPDPSQNTRADRNGSGAAPPDGSGAKPDDPAAKKEAGKSEPAGQHQNHTETTTALVDGKPALHFKVVTNGAVKQRIEFLPVENGPTPRADSRNFAAVNAQFAGTTGQEGKKLAAGNQTPMLGSPIGAARGPGFSLTG